MRIKAAIIPRVINIRTSHRPAPSGERVGQVTRCAMHKGFTREHEGGEARELAALKPVDRTQCHSANSYSEADCSP